MVNLQKLLDTPIGEAPQVVMLPGGHWKLKCEGVHFSHKEGKNPGVSFFWSPVKPAADVSKTALKDLNGHDYTTEEFLDYKFLDSVARKAEVDDLLQLLGVEKGTALTVVEADGTRKTNPAVRDAALGREIVAKLKIGEDRRTKEPRMEVEGYLPLSAMPA